MSKSSQSRSITDFFGKPKAPQSPEPAQFKRRKFTVNESSDEEPELNVAEKKENTPVENAPVEVESVKVEPIENADPVKSSPVRVEAVKSSPKSQKSTLSPPKKAESSQLSSASVEKEQESKTDAADNKDEDDTAGMDTKQVSKAVWNMFSSDNTDVTKEIKWQKNDKTPFAALAKTFEAIEATTKRLMILEILTKFLVKVIQLSPDDLLSCVYLCINRLAPTWKGMELGIGETLLIKAIASATGRAVPKIKADLQEHGDLGKVAQSSRSNQPTMFQPKPLTVQSVFKTLKEIAAITGQSSMNKKIDKIKFLLVSCRNNEAKYLIRALEGKLRIGLAEQSVLVALAHASVLSRENIKKSEAETTLVQAVETVKQVFSELPDYEEIIPVLLDQGVETLAEKCKLTPGIPLKPMLAHPTKSITDVLNRFENIAFTCEYKYDGERAQIHLLPGGKVQIFSRNQEDMSQKYPDIIEHMKLVPKESVTSFVMDAEAVAWDREKKMILPFQVLSTRKRKDVNTSDITVQVCVFAFDLLYLNGEPLIRLPLKRRREILRESFLEREGEFAFAKHMDGQSVEQIQTFLDESIEGNCEGLMVKTVEKDSSYEPSKRSRNWLKVKKDYLEGAGDSLDLVVIGGYIGKGKRTGVYGGFLLACYDEEREEYQAICKIGTGFSDEILAEHGKFFKQHEMAAPKPYYAVTEGVKPDVWFEPVQVWEVKTADLSISPVYPAAVGLVDPNKGVSLRFPRFIRIRDDKSPDAATSASQVADMYRGQKINHGFNDPSAEDDVY